METAVPVLEMKNISKVYGNGVYANKNISFSVLGGEIHALVGENGAGKSTLMKILFGMEKPDQGEIISDGKILDFHSPQDAMAAGIGMVHQHFKLVESMSVMENVTLGYEPLKKGLIDRKSAKSKVLQALKVFELEDILEEPVDSLPVGTKQKVEIVKALYRGARILILDEPTAVLTPQETEELFQRLKQLKKDGFTVIFISHKLREVKEISDRVSIMRKGEMIASCITAEVSEQDISEKMMGTGYSPELLKKEAQLGEVLLDVSHVACRGAGSKNAVDDVSFTVRSGEIVGVAGVEGNGQNELIAMITGLYAADKGSIRVMGQDARNLDVKKRRELGLAYIPSDRIKLGLAVSMPIEENLITTKLDQSELYSGGMLSVRKVRALAGRLIGEYKIKCGSSQTPVNMLSGGNMQKVVVAREFTQGAKLIIAEQPTRGIDVGAAKFIHEELVRQRDEGCAVLLVSADMEELYKLSDSIMVIYDGSIAAYFKEPGNITEKELGHYMLGVKKQAAQEIEGAYYEKEKSAV